MVDINDPFLIVIAVVVPLVLIAINLLFVLYFIQLPPAGFRGCADYTTMTLLVSRHECHRVAPTSIRYR